jgi:hypothetical protein
MAASQNILAAACAAVMITESLSQLIVAIMRRRRSQEPSALVSQPGTVTPSASRSQLVKLWTVGVAGLSLLVVVISLALYSLSGWQDFWLGVSVGALTVAIIANFFRFLARLLLNPRAPLSRRLARSTALVLAVVVAFVTIYCKLARV